MNTIDVHAHLAALPAEDNGCYMSPRMMGKPLLRLTARMQGLPLDDPETANRIYLEKFLAELRGSEHVSRAVALAMDGVYTRSGEPDRERTDFLISNDCVLKTAAEHEELLAGISVHPYRKDALDELERCKEGGAVLCKWLANAQVFDPADEKCRPFYRKLAELGMPLLSHVGFEFSLIGQDQSVADAERLRPALEEGAVVIAAHGCSSGIFVWEKHFDVMLELMARYERFYADVSALTLPNRVRVLLKLARHPEVHDRLLFGSDYPLPVFGYPAWLGKWSGLRRVLSARNRFDRQYRILESLGVRAGADFRSLSGTGGRDPAVL